MMTAGRRTRACARHRLAAVDVSAAHIERTVLRVPPRRQSTHPGSVQALTCQTLSARGAQGRPARAVGAAASYVTNTSTRRPPSLFVSCLNACVPRYTAAHARVYGLPCGQSQLSRPRPALLTCFNTGGIAPSTVHPLPLGASACCRPASPRQVYKVQTAARPPRRPMTTTTGCCMFRAVLSLCLSHRPARQARSRSRTTTPQRRTGSLPHPNASPAQAASRRAWTASSCRATRRAGAATRPRNGATPLPLRPPASALPTRARPNPSATVRAFAGRSWAIPAALSTIAATICGYAPSAPRASLPIRNSARRSNTWSICTCRRSWLGSRRKRLPTIVCSRVARGPWHSANAA